MTSAMIGATESPRVQLTFYPFGRWTVDSLKIIKGFSAVEFINGFERKKERIIVLKQRMLGGKNKTELESGEGHKYSYEKGEIMGETDIIWTYFSLASGWKSPWLPWSMTSLCCFSSVSRSDFWYRLAWSACSIWDLARCFYLSVWSQKVGLGKTCSSPNPLAYRIL